MNVLSNPAFDFSPNRTAASFQWTEVPMDVTGELQPSFGNYTYVGYNPDNANMYMYGKSTYYETPSRPANGTPDG